MAYFYESCKSGKRAPHERKYLTYLQKSAKFLTINQQN